MIKNIFFIMFFLISLTLKVNAACDDIPGDGVDYSGCQFSQSQDLSASYIPNSSLNLTSFIKVNFPNISVKYTVAKSFSPVIFHKAS